jgi:hypothetical protein
MPSRLHQEVAMSSTLAANSRSTVAIRITAAIATLAVAITAVATRPEMVMTALHAVMGMTR